MKTTIAIFPLIILLAACNPDAPDSVGSADEGLGQGKSRVEPTQFNGVWEVFGRTGNEDGSNEPVCGHETGYGKATISGSKITGDIANKSGFEYTVEGTIDNTGKIKAMLIYSGYDAAELFGRFSAETNTAKGTWKDAVNACPGVWHAKRISQESGENQAESEQDPVQAGRKPVSDAPGQIAQDKST